MAEKEVIWTDQAIESFNQVISYLEEKWTNREVENFVTTTDRVVQYIGKKPLMFRKTNRKNLREALVTEHNLLIYKVYNTHISLITFWDTRQHPKKKKKYK